MEHASCPQCDRILRGSPRMFCTCGASFVADDVVPIHHEGRVLKSSVRLEVLRGLWDELHRYALANSQNWDVDRTKDWFKDWSARVPRYGCNSCGSRWRSYIRENPPDFSSPVAFFEWTVAAHNHVSTKHAVPRKPPMSIFDAKVQYGWRNPENERERICRSAQRR